MTSKDPRALQFLLSFFDLNLRLFGQLYNDKIMFHINITNTESRLYTSNFIISMETNSIE